MNKIKKQFEVIDRGATVAREFHRFSYVNPRYFVRDTTTNEIVDEFTTKSEANATARDMNRAS